MMISTIQDLEQAVLDYGLLPFFSNNIPGFSVEEMAAPDRLFGGSDGEDGCWEWKGPVIQGMKVAYGKFFRRKAGFVSIDFYPDFVNYRRELYPLVPGSIEESLLEIIRERESATSAELRRIIFGSPGRKCGDKDDTKPRRQALEAPLQKLQMGGWLLIADFQYKYTRLGDRYGWGEAVYTTPELWFGREALKCPYPFEESFGFVAENLSRKLPDATRSQIIKLLR